MLAHKNAVFLEAQAIAKKKQEVEIVHDIEKQARSEKLMDEVAETLDISPEDRDDLNAIILGAE